VYEHIAELGAELEELEARLSELYASGDQAAARDAGRRHAHLRPLVDTYRDYCRAENGLHEARSLLDGETDSEMRNYLHGEVVARQAEVDALDARLTELLVPPDLNEGRNVIIEIRGAEGGEEANLWASDLADMYRRFAEAQGWKVDVLATQSSERGGVREVSFVVKGDGAWGGLKYEGGPHRVQRVPVTESQGRVHTSVATVAVLPEADEVDVRVEPGDLQVDVYRSSGPGGQSVNTTDSAVRMTHLPSGIVVTCQDEKSQLQNKEKALRILRARLLEVQRREQAEEESSTRRDQVKGGSRSEKVRTYNYKENRVTDHRIGLTVHALDQVLAGHLDEIVAALADDERARALSDPHPR